MALRPAKGVANSRAAIVRSVWIIAAVVVAAVSAFLALRSRGPDIAPENAALDRPQAIEESRTDLPALAGSSTPASTGSISPQPANASPSSEKAGQLVKLLGELPPGELTQEKADEWKQHLEQLIEQGRAAVPTLEQYFDSNENVRFGAADAKLLGEPTLRMALIKALFDIPTPDNVQLQEKVLQSTNDPDEIALIARQLEQQEPGEHYRSIIQAARRGLQESKNGRLADRDTAPLLKILEGYGIPTK